MRSFLAAAIVAASFAAVPTAAEAACGWYAFAGAFKSYRSAQQRANRVGGRVFDVDASNSPNAGQGWYAVGFGPTNRASANSVRRDYRASGVRGAYVANRCSY